MKINEILYTFFTAVLTFYYLYKWPSCLSSQKYDILEYILEFQT
jgi:hypothetical protein